MTFDKEEVGGLEVGVDDALFMDSLNAQEHFFPILAIEGDVKFGIIGLELFIEHFVEVNLAVLHEDIEDAFVFVDFVVKEADDTIFVLKSAEQVNFTFVASDGSLVGFVKVDSFHGKDLEVLGHNIIDAGGASTANEVEFAVGLAVDYDV